MHQVPMLQLDIASGAQPTAALGALTLPCLLLHQQLGLYWAIASVLGPYAMVEAPDATLIACSASGAQTQSW